MTSVCFPRCSNKRMNTNVTKLHLTQHLLFIIGTKHATKCIKELFWMNVYTLRLLFLPFSHKMCLVSRLSLNMTQHYKIHKYSVWRCWQNNHAFAYHSNAEANVFFSDVARVREIIQNFQIISLQNLCDGVNRLWQRKCMVVTKKV